MVDGKSHFDGGGFDEQYTLMGVDFWRTPNCIYDGYDPSSCPRFDTRLSLGRDVGEPGQVQWPSICSV